MRGAYFKSLNSLIMLSFSTIKNNSSWYYDFALGLPLVLVFFVGIMFIFSRGYKMIKERSELGKSEQDFFRIRHKFSGKKIIQNKKNLLVIFTFTCFYLSIYLSNNASNWLWNILPLQFIVYPYRFLFITVFTGSIIAGYLGRKSAVVGSIFIVLA